MNRNYETAVKQIEGMRKDWQDVMGLGWIDIDHKYLEVYNEDDHQTIADTEALWQYRIATVRWYLPSVVRLDYEDIEDALVHEYTHILIAPIESKLPEKHIDLCEFTVEGIVKAIKTARKR